MNREEAIKIIDCYDINFYDLSGEKIPAEKLAEAFDMAIEALSADAVSRETYHNLVTASNDIDRALREYQDKEENGELVSVVWCKECRYAEHRKMMPHQVYCKRDMLSIYGTVHDDDDFCKFGERREP